MHNFTKLYREMEEGERKGAGHREQETYHKQVIVTKPPQLASVDDEMETEMRQGWEGEVEWEYPEIGLVVRASVV